jgi:hypothetical protein
VAAHRVREGEVTVLAAILWALAFTALAVLGLALLVVAMPLHLRVRGAVRDGEPSGLVRMAWAFGLLAVELEARGLSLRVAGVPVYRKALRDLFRRREGRERTKPKERRERPERERARGEGGGKLAAFLEHRAKLLHMLRRLAGTLHLRLRVRGTVGLADPADTAALGQVLRSIADLPGLELDVELDWLDETLEGEAVGSARVWVPETLAVAVALLFERGSWAAVRALAS